MKLLQMSFAGGVMILVIAVLRAVLIHRLPKKTFLILWAVVLCRLLLPYEFKSEVSIYTFARKIPYLKERAEEHSMVQQPLTEHLPASQQSPVAQLFPTAQSSLTEQLPVSQPSPTEQLPAAQQPSASQLSSIAPIAPKQLAKAAVTFPFWTFIQIIGTLLCSACFAFFYVRGCRKFAQSLPIENEVLKDWYMTHHLKRRLKVRQSDRISAPLSYGVFRPVILMPKTCNWENKNQVYYILEHEYVHIQRWDAAVKLVMAAAVCIHWFNPLVWVMYILFNRDIELSCDETVLRRFGEKTRAAYAMLLVSMEERKSSALPFGSSFSKTAIEERITAIMKIKKISVMMLAAAAAMIVTITAVFATSGTTAKETSASIPNTDFTDEEYEKLLALKYDGYENMSISQYQEKVWTDTDNKEYQELLERFSKDETIYGLRNINDTAEFLHYILMPLCRQNWQSNDFSGAASTAYPDVVEQAGFEYTFTLTILDADHLTVGEYKDARSNMSRKLNHILEGRPEEELQDETEMAEYIQKQINSFVAQYSSDSLEITVDDGGSRRLVVKVEEDPEIEEAAFRESQEEWNKALEPYFFLGLTCEYDATTDDFKMYYQGKEVKSITDEEKGIWISAHSGTGRGIYAEDAVELFAVYENGELTSLREADKQEEARILRQRYKAAEEREERPSYGTEADYKSLLTLKTADYKNMTLEEFNRRLLDWANEDYDRMERINIDTAWKDWQVPLSEEEKSFAALSVWASGVENAEIIQSNYTGRPQEDPVLGEYKLDKTEEGKEDSVWCNMYYQFSYHIPDKSRITVGERDHCIEGMVNSVQTFWDEKSLDELLEMEESDIEAVLQTLAEKYSNELISVSIDKRQVGFEKMDERGIS